MRKPYRLEFEVNALPKVLTNMKHNSWKAIHFTKKRMKQLVFEQLIGKVPKKPLEKAKLTLIRHSSKEPDFDNLVASFKSVTDALTIAGVILDDRMSVIGQPAYEWRKAKMKCGKITVIVEEI